MGLCKSASKALIVVGVTHMHCTHKATRNTTKAAKTSAKVPQTNFRKSDFSGAIRKYETRIDIFTVLDASTKRVCPAKDAWELLESAYGNTPYTSLTFRPCSNVTGKRSQTWRSHPYN